MLVPRRSPDVAAGLARVDKLAAALRREAAQADPDPFDDATVAAVAGLAEVMRAQAVELDALRRRMARLARRAT